MKVINLKEKVNDDRLDEISKDLDKLKQVAKEGRLGKMILVFDEMLEDSDETDATEARHVMFYDEGQGTEAIAGMLYHVLWNTMMVAARDGTV